MHSRCDAKWIPDWAEIADGCSLWAVGEGEQQEEGGDNRILIPLDPWSNTSTGDEDWEVVYDFPDSGEVWEVTPVE